MENEQYLYLYFAVRKEQLERITTKRKSILNTDVYSIKVKKYHSCRLDPELEFSTEIYAESQSYVLLRTVVKWYDHNLKILAIHSDRFCEIHYGLGSFVLTTYYSDKNLKDAFKDYDGLKILDDYEVKGYLYFLVRQSTLDKLAYKTKTKENHYKLQVGSNKKFTIGCDVININNDTDPYVLLKSTSDLQNSIFLKDAIKSFENDSTVIGNGYICKLYYNKYVIPDPSYYPNMTAFIFYFTDEDVTSIMSIYDFEEKDIEHSPTYSFDIKNGIGLNIISECAKNNKITKENKDMPPYKHHINPGRLSVAYFGDCSGVYHGNIQKAKYVTVKDIKFNGPATIIFFEDGSKEVVKRQKNDKIDKEKAIYMAMLKHKNKKLFSIINKALSSEDPEKALAYELIKYEGGDAKLLHKLCNDAIKAEKPKKKIKKNNAKVATKKTNKKSKEDK